jgi:hypothetical protein
MLSGAKHLRLLYSDIWSVDIESEIESLASRTSSAALQLRVAQNDKPSSASTNDLCFRKNSLAFAAIWF